MCGIAGYLGSKSRLDAGVGANLSRSLRHRGPDDEGQELVELNSRPDACVLLVHRRLSIIDLSPQGHQPMQDPVTGNWIVYNGEIYNFKELRNDLTRQGATLCSQTDTEVILKGYGLRGRRILDELCGMFACAIFDRAAEELFLAVDPLGIKPLYYYATSDGTFLFASEIRALLNTGMVPRRVDPVALESYLSYGAVQAPHTMIAGVSALLPGAYMKVKADGRIDGPHTYWRIPYAASGDRSHSEKQAPEELHDLLDGIVRQHLISDVPLGVLLSGGIDSSSVLALASRHASSIKAFSVTFREGKFSESPYSGLMAKQYRTDHQEICLSEQGLLRTLPDALAALDQPSIDGTNVFMISQAVRKAGVTVVLSGQGGDEIFAGYPTFRNVLSARNLTSRLPVPSSAYRVLGQMLSVVGDHGRIGKLGQYLSSARDSFSTYFLFRQLYPPAVRRALFPAGADGATAEGLPRRLWDSLRREAESLEPVNMVSLLETRTYLANMLLRDGDVMSMAHSIEVRVPFLDRRIYEVVARLPGAMKLDSKLPKPLLLRAMNGLLPEQIYARPKQGFTFPWEHWLRRELRDLADEALCVSRPFSDLRIEPWAVTKLWKGFLEKRRGLTWPRGWALIALREWAARNHASL